MIRVAVLTWLLLAGPLAALELELPSTARLTAERNTNPDRFAAPVGIYSDGAVRSLIVEGDVQRAAWRLEASGLTSLQIILPLREQLTSAGYEVLLDCAEVECGGYDFRFATEVLPGPNMYVNLRSYHVITARRVATDGTASVISILASASPSSSYVQLIQAGSESGVAVIARSVSSVVVADVAPVEAAPTDISVTGGSSLAEQLLEHGHVVLSGLDFDSGTSDLGPGPFAQLETLAAFLADRPGIRIALVGHTDSVGSLDANIALSKRRALSVRQRMIDAYEISGARMEAEGMGYLAPVASNLDGRGRDANRRVEAILLSTE